MAEVILMPRLSDTMTEGVIAAWHKKVGDSVKKGDLLAEVETDKATMELESYKEGTLLHIGIDKGGKLQVNDLLAIIGEPGEEITSLIANSETITDQKTKPAKKEEKSSTLSKTDSKMTTETIDISKMEEVVLMPRLSDTMTEGVIAAWHKKIGDTVKKGDILAEIETDKATMELESYKNGELLYIGAKDGEKINVNGLLCIIGEKGKVNVAEIVNAAKTGINQNSSLAQPVQQNKAEEIKEETNKAESKPAELTNGKLKASPLAKKLAREKGIDIHDIQGSGDGGRIIKSDIDNYTTPANTAASGGGGGLPRGLNLPVISGKEGFADTPNNQMRKIIAKRLGESKFSAPHFYLTMEINMDNAITTRTQMNEFGPVKVSFQDMLIKACANSLIQHPAVNSSWMGDYIRTWHHIHIGSAVAVPDGLIVPVIKFAYQKSVFQIAAEAKELYTKAKEKKLQPPEFSGNTFTISNLGMMDIDEFTAIINPPDSCILAVGKIKEVVIKKGEGFHVTNIMKVTMSCDHRSVDGAVGASFLQTLKKYMENPVSLLV